MQSDAQFAAQPYEEQPQTLFDQIVGYVVLAGALVAGVLLGRTVHVGDDLNHTPAFVSLALLSGLAVYVLWLVWALRTLRYALADGELRLRQGWQQRSISLSPSASLHLYRWRSRWFWSGGVQRDLGVAEVDVFPPVWFWRPSATWVLVYRTPDGGEKRALAFRPSPQLLNEIKAWVREAQATAN